MASNIYKINESKVISETIDGETIIINLQTGNYYNVNKTAAFIWHNIEHGKSLDDMSKSFSTSYNITQDKATKFVSEIIDFLVKEDLIEESKDVYVNNPADDNSSEKEKDQKEEFTPPKIEKFDDMKEMIFADPIHDVKEEGWPNIK